MGMGNRIFVRKSDFCPKGLGQITGGQKTELNFFLFFIKNIFCFFYTKGRRSTQAKKIQKKIPTFFWKNLKNAQKFRSTQEIPTKKRLPWRK
jgi:hypothetical protein